ISKSRPEILATAAPHSGERTGDDGHRHAEDEDDGGRANEDVECLEHPRPSPDEPRWQCFVAARGPVPMRQRYLSMWRKLAHPLPPVQASEAGWRGGG